MLIHCFCNCVDIAFAHILSSSASSCFLVPRFSQSVRRATDFANFETLSTSACDCDTTGSRDGGMCDAFSGQCICKQNVEGQRCDRCKYGFFNLRPDDPDGCQGETNKMKKYLISTLRGREASHSDRLSNALICFTSTECRCHVSGSIGSCDQQTGSCECDRLAVGPLCDRCLVRLTST